MPIEPIERRLNQVDRVPPSQSKRIAKLETPLGEDKLVLTRFDGDEGMSDLFEYRIDALSEDENIDFDKAIGKNCSVTFKTYGNQRVSGGLRVDEAFVDRLPRQPVDERQVSGGQASGGNERVFNGVLVEAQWVGILQSHYAYRLVLRPWFWLLGRRADCRMFKDKNVFDIIEEVFKAEGFSDYEIKASRGDYPKIEYCVQYRETDLAFVCRLMEEEGIYFFFEHSRDRHKMILADKKSCHVPIKAQGGKIPFIALAGQDRRAEEHIYHWVAERRFRTGKMGTDDYDYMKPTTDLAADAQATERYERSKLEAYDYPGRHTEQDVGKRRATVRLQAEQALDKRKYAAGDAVSLYPGGLFKLERHGTDNEEYVVVRSTHSYVLEQYRSGEAGTPGEIYHGHYEVLKSSIPFRAPLLTPKPLVHGPQTAFVVASKGNEKEEIDVDKEGRIFLKFHWDRQKDKISRSVRVAQMWSGKSWGWQVIPRIGMEVVVEFLEGDPDQPLVVGTVYNKDYRYPYELPDNKTISGVKSRSTKNSQGYNEFIFEDKAGSEEVKMHAEKDHNTVIRNAETRVIGEMFKPPMGAASRETTLKNGDEKMTVSAGNWDVDVAQMINIKANLMITIECGASKIVMTPALMTLQSPIIKIN